MEAHQDPAIQVLREYDAEAAKALKALLFNDKPEKYQKWVNLLQDPVFKKRYNMPLDKQRDLAYARIKRVCDERIVSIFDFMNDPKNIFTAHEMLGYADGSLATKFTVQFNLFGGTLTGMHTERHLPFMKEVDSLKHMGCFCFTELGYGNNAPKMETTATYDHKTQTFDIHSPSVASQKFWITNGACHANYAVVFAQTIVSGKNEGVQPFIVRIREDDMKPSKGVTIEDMGIKMGLNGIDNGRLIFDHVKVPREMLLNKLADVNAEGKFVCDIPKVTNRFFKVTDRLLSGRLCISAMCLSASKGVLMHTIRYSQQRLTVGPTGESDCPIMSYQLQQNAVLPHLARVVVVNLGYNKAKDIFENPKGREHEQVRIFCAIKCISGWTLKDLAGVCRERCGGGSFLTHSIIPLGIESAHSGMTAEGDNRVLMQKVVKDIFEDMRKERHTMPKLTMCPKKQIPAMKSIANLETMTNLIYYREAAEIKAMGKTLKKKIMDEGKPFFDVWMYEVSDEIQQVAEAFGERFILENAMQALHAATQPGLKKLLEANIFLHCCTEIMKHLGWYLSNECISVEAASEMETVQQQAVKDFVPYMNSSLEGLGVPQECPHLAGPIARDYVAFNAQEDNENFDAAGELFDFRKTGAPRARM